MEIKIKINSEDIKKADGLVRKMLKALDTEELSLIDDFNLSSVVSVNMTAEQFSEMQEDMNGK